MPTLFAVVALCGSLAVIVGAAAVLRLRRSRLRTIAVADTSTDFAHHLFAAAAEFESSPSVRSVTQQTVNQVAANKPWNQPHTSEPDPKPSRQTKASL